MPLLHHTILPARGPTIDRTVLLLHGILGSGGNLRGLARALLAADPNAQCVLVDLRMHGQSQGFAAPHTVAACAEDLHALAATLPSLPTDVVGHSFGGKVALAYARHRPDLRRIALLDSNPSHRVNRHGSEQIIAVIDTLAGLPITFETRAAFVAHVQAQGLSRKIADWLATNLDRTDAGFRFRLELTAIRSLLDDYFAHDLWPVLADTQARVDLVIAGRSDVFREADLARAQRLCAEHPARVRVHHLPQAGHWVHVDDLPGLTVALTSP